MVNGKRKNIGLASARGANRAVANAKSKRNQNARAKLNDPTTQISRAKVSIRKGTVNLNRVFNPKSKAERF
jgi:hypothetical protein